MLTSWQGLGVATRSYQRRTKEAGGRLLCSKQANFGAGCPAVCLNLAKYVTEEREAIAVLINKKSQLCVGSFV